LDMLMEKNIGELERSPEDETEDFLYSLEFRVF